jgi:hypothetical protein
LRVDQDNPRRRPDTEPAHLGRVLRVPEMRDRAPPQGCMTANETDCRGKTKPPSLK